MGRQGIKRGGFERHLLIRLSYYFVFFTTDGKSAINMGQSCSQPVTDRLILTDMNLTHNVLIAEILCDEAVLVAVYSALRFKAFVFFFVYSACNVYKVRECHPYIMYIKTVLYLLEIHCLMDNEFVKVHNEPQIILYGEFHI
jgi:hypothetical protein